jgi:2-alkyl-3-oxoalkanoate reductase
MKVLVTGGGGFLGQAICGRLAARGYEVASFNRGHYPELVPLGVEQLRGDLADAGAVEAAVAGRQAVFHVGAKAGAWGSYASYYDANVRGTEHVIAACRKHGASKLVYTSSPSVTHRANHPVEGGNERDTPYGTDFKAPYPETKKLAEEAVLAANDSRLAVVALRPRLIWGPGDNQLLPRLVERARRGRLRFIDGGHNRIDTTYIDNAAQAHLDAFDHLWPGSVCAGKAYFISNGEPRELRDIVNALLCAAAAPQVEKSIPFGVAYAAGVVMEGLWSALPLKGEPPMTRFLAEQLATPHWYDISAAARDFGYRPRVTIENGLQRLAAWWHAARP